VTFRGEKKGERESALSRVASPCVCVCIYILFQKNVPEQRSRSITKTIIGALFSFSVRARAFVVVNYVKERFLDLDIHLQNQQLYV